VDLNRNIEEYDLVFIDLETTGLDVITGDSICEVGAFKIKNRKAIAKFHSLVNPGKPVPPEAYRIHKISDEALKDAPRFEAIAGKLNDFLKDSVICAYNIGFDIGFINYQLKKSDYPEVASPAIDILSMARDMLSLSRYNLETAARYLDRDCSGTLHRALDDAKIACRVFYKLVDKLKDKRIENLSQYLPLYGFANEIFKHSEDKKTTLIKEAILKTLTLKLVFFSRENTVEEEKITPLRLLQEGRYSYLLYQKSREDTCRIRLNRILEVEVL
jgi:DNA polymerase-3 subunit epsilon